MCYSYFTFFFLNLFHITFHYSISLVRIKVTNERLTQNVSAITECELNSTDKNHRSLE